MAKESEKEELADEKALGGGENRMNKKANVVKMV